MNTIHITYGHYVLRMDTIHITYGHYTYYVWTLYILHMDTIYYIWMLHILHMDAIYTYGHYLHMDTSIIPRPFSRRSGFTFDPNNIIVCIITSSAVYWQLGISLHKYIATSKTCLWTLFTLCICIADCWCCLATISLNLNNTKWNGWRW